jgi:hypothetical protein
MMPTDITGARDEPDGKALGGNPFDNTRYIHIAMTKETLEPKTVYIF